MKIYNKIVLDMDGNILEEDSYEYDGPMNRLRGGDVEAPEPSPEERELQTLQLDLARQQAAQQEALQPFILQNQGLTQDPETGELRRLTPEELEAGRTPGEQRAFDITRESQERQLAALRGELPVSPALEQELQQQQTRLEEGLSRRLGGGFATTTAGQQALARQQQTAGVLREEARRGQIGQGQGILASRLAGQLGQQGQQFGQFQGIGAGGLGLLGGLGQAQQGFQFNRQLEFQAAQQTQANRANQLAGIGQLVGTVGGAVLGGPIGAGIGASIFGGSPSEFIG